MPPAHTFDLIVPGPPDEGAERLQRQTRFRPFPYQGSMLGGGARPLGGWVRDTGLRVALDPRDLLQRSLALAVGSIEPLGDGRCRVRGTASLPTIFTTVGTLDAELATIAPGATGHASGHFAVSSADDKSAKGFCGNPPTS